MHKSLFFKCIVLFKGQRKRNREQERERERESCRIEHFCVSHCCSITISPSCVHVARLFKMSVVPLRDVYNSPQVCRDSGKKHWRKRGFCRRKTDLALFGGFQELFYSNLIPSTLCFLHIFYFSFIFIFRFQVIVLVL